MSAWTQEGEQLAHSLEAIEDEGKIKALCEEVVGKINDRYSNPASRKNPLAAVRKAIATKYPATRSKKAPYQYFSDGGKGKKERWEHLALKYLTLSERDWEDLGGENRAEWKAMQQATTTVKTEEMEDRPEIQGSLEDMTLKQLNLDTNTQEILEDALTQSGMSLADFIRQAIKVYAKTVTGKKRKYTEDLTTVPTDKLLNDPAYSTHPGRAEELVKRAIRAIKTYNDEIATEPQQRWIITQSAVTEITGSRASTVQEIMKQYRDDIDSHHQKHPEFFNEDGTLNKYQNRKRGTSISQTILLSHIVPDGLDE